jgi:hypothetical protein
VQLQTSWSAADEDRVAAGTGCDTAALIKQQLAAAGGDVDAAVEAIIEILAAEEEPPSTAGEAVAPAVAVAVALTDTTAAASSTAIAVGDEQQQAATAGGDPGEAAGGVATNSTPAEGEQDSIDATTPAAATADAVTGGSTYAQHAEERTAADVGARSHPAALPSTRQHAAVAASGPGGSRGVKLKGGSKLKHAKAGGTAGGDSDKRPSRNKPCPCGSGRKHKNCCELKGSSSAKPSSQELQAGDGLPVQLATLHI